MVGSVAVQLRVEGTVRLDQVRLAVLRVADAALDEFADAIAHNADRNIEEWGISDNGALEASINVESHFLDKSVVVGAPHGVYVEYGTGPAAGRKQYLPPLPPILAWVKRNLRVAQSGDLFFKPETKTGSRPARKDEALRVAQAVRWGIYHNGIKPRPFFSTAVQQAIASFPTIVARAARKVNAAGRPDSTPAAEGGAPA